MTAPESVVRREPGHKPVNHGGGDWRCECGERLGNVPTNQERARDAMRTHRKALAHLAIRRGRGRTVTVKADLEHRADELERQFRGYVQFDWLYFGRYDRLHAPVDMDVDTYEWRAENVTFACGWHAATAWIPGIFSRMSTPRCAHCCDRLGLPRGTGSPKNDPECRALLGLDTMNPEARRVT